MIMEKKYYLYAGYCELFISDKPLPDSYFPQGVFGDIAQAEQSAESYDEWINYDEDILEDTEYYRQFNLGGDVNCYLEHLNGKSDPHVFNYKKLVA